MRSSSHPGKFPDRALRVDESLRVTGRRRARLVAARQDAVNDAQHQQEKNGYSYGCQQQLEHQEQQRIQGN
jgi:hypothetical protein